MAVHDLLQRNHRPSEVEARQALCGNLCRCTGYRGALAAVQAVAEARGAVDELPEQPEPESEQQDAAAPAQSAAQPPAQSAADLPLAGEMPLYADSEAWVEAEPPHSAQPTATGTGDGVGIEYGTDYAHPGGVYETAEYPAYPAAPQYEAAPYDAAYDTAYEHGRYEATPAHGTAHDGPPFEGTPAHGTPYIPTPAHGTPYDGTGYEAAGYPAATYENTIYEQHPGYDGSTPAHGITLPEDDHA